MLKSITMKKQSGFLILITILAISGIGLAYYLGTQQGKKKEPKPFTEPTPVSTQTPTTLPTLTIPVATNTPIPTATPSVKQGWTTYKNEQYGFEISYPENYQALDDKKNLYGWPDAVVLLYKGGQSYDLPIEVWDTFSDYESRYKTQMDNLTIKKVADKYITLLNMNREEEVDQIIATFKITD